jgi:alanine-glyoxylate transaminase / serine-glyoxylate transaminase / serine-pyruvate transaminase
LVFSSGYFAERIAEMGRRHGANLIRCEKPWGEVFTEAEAREAIEREQPGVVAFVHAETSTGALQAPLAITRPAHEAGALVVADCVTSLGATPIRVDESGIDVAFSCSQKGLSCPPGLSPFTISPRAEEWLKARKIPNSIWYLDLKLLSEYFGAQRRYHHTVPVSSFYALREGLTAILDEGVERRFERHARMHAEFVRRIEAMGLRMHVAEPAHRIPNLNTVRVPEGLDDALLRRTLLAEHDIEIAGGFGPLAGKIFRIGIMGPLATPGGLDLFFGAFERCLAAVGAPAARM